jgi:hypothetical protein
MQYLFAGINSLRLRLLVQENAVFDLFGGSNTNPYAP